MLRTKNGLLDELIENSVKQGIQRKRLVLLWQALFQNNHVTQRDLCAVYRGHNCIGVRMILSVHRRREREKCNNSGGNRVFQEHSQSLLGAARVGDVDSVIPAPYIA